MSCNEIRSAVRQSEPWQKMLSSSYFASHSAYPLKEFDSFLVNGDCTAGQAEAYIERLTSTPAPPMALPFNTSGYGISGEGSNIGQLLRTAANWDDDYGGENGERHIMLPNGEPIRFSQRGLNTVLIAVWCCSGAECMWDWMSRLIYIGGDADTVGAVCGQIAGPLLPEADVLATFSRFAAFEDFSDRRPCTIVAGQAARRFFRRALLFCGGSWSELSNCPRLVDPFYESFVTEAFSNLSQKKLLCANGSGSATRVLWLDRALTAAPHTLDRGSDRGRRMNAEEAAGLGLIEIRPAKTVDELREQLELMKCGAASYDCVVTELHVGTNPEGGLEVLHTIDSLWPCRDVDTRPAFHLLSPSWNPVVANIVKQHPRSGLLRCDRPQDIIKSLVEGSCIAAKIPEGLTPLGKGRTITVSM
eukprot:TRINITY_DN93461_c0_g1_i1.p1 TRINITY_DN93461_c0_g1~~TRINITY_DN93461_c0_g1_i1.p1  ORF type:complete len:443 (+),score=57.61 TRINITY_DN93461_c0_g1_i1:81-1331(+)